MQSVWNLNHHYTCAYHLSYYHSLKAGKVGRGEGLPALDELLNKRGYSPFRPSAFWGHTSSTMMKDIHKNIYIFTKGHIKIDIFAGHVTSSIKFNPFTLTAAKSGLTILIKNFLTKAFFGKFLRGKC